MNSADFTDPTGRLLTVPATAPRRRYTAFVPDPLPPAVEDFAIQAVRPLLSEADQALGELIGIGRLLPDPDLLVRSYLFQEAVASSAIEGTKATFSDLVAYDAARLSPPDSDVVDLVNYTAALDLGLRAIEKRSVDADLVRRLHRTLMSGARGEEYSTPGEFRTIQNHIGGGREPADGHFVPPPPGEMHDSLEAFFGYMSGAAERQAPILVEAAWLHYQFETIHPFLDGNGRVGRLLIPLWIAHRRRYPHPLLYLSPYLLRHRGRYNDLLFAVSARGVWDEWLRFFLQAVIERASDATVLADQIIALGRGWHERLDAAGAGRNSHRLADLVHRRIGVIAGTVEAELGVTGPTAYKAIASLEDAGILQEATGRARDRFWRSPELIALFS